MNTNYFFESLNYLKPEATITVFLAVVLCFDLALPKMKKVLPYLTSLGILIACAFAIQDFLTVKQAIPVMTTSRLPLLAFDSLGIFFKILVLSASFLIVIFSVKSLELKDAADRMGEYYCLMLGMIIGMLLLVSATDFLLIYLALELMSFSSYVLAGFLKNSQRSSEASLKYVLYGGISSGIMLFGISLLFGMAQSTNIYVVAHQLAMSPNSPVLVLLVSLMVFAGIGYKISSVPFHFWTPDVYEGAPITITAYLSVASKAAGFALLIRFVRTVFPIDNMQLFSNYAVNWKQILVYLSILTMTVGNLSALWQDNLKRMLAYSSIAHAGYLLATLATMNNEGIAAVLVYLVIYVIMNLGAFFIIMLIKNEIGSEHIDDYNGLGFKMPLYGIALAIFLVSLTGLPPTAGFIGKFYIFTALLKSNMVSVALIALLNSVISLYYYIRVLKHMYLTDAPEGTEAISVSASNIILTVVLAAPVLIFGLYFSPIAEFAKNSAVMLGIR
jgi:NADH-quinone oxidoreductase subunit N